MTVRKVRKRARQRGITHIPSILEAAMVMGWFVVMIVGEKTVSSANDARRSAENSAQQTASTTSGAACQGGHLESSPGLPPATGAPNIFPNGMPQAQGAIGAIAGLGVPPTKTFPYYVDPLENVKVQTKATAQGENDRAKGKSFEGQRQLGCVEKPLDSPQGSLEDYRMPIWAKNLQGY